MENTGTWNSDYAILFFGVLVAPFFLYFLGRCLALAMEISAPRPVPIPHKEEAEPIKITVDFCGSCKDIKNTRSKTPKSSKKPRKPTPVKKEAPKKSKVCPFELDAIGALRGLGIKKTDAKNLVRSLCAKKDYNSLESLLNDCFMCINKS